jgi:hypothetical protein
VITLFRILKVLNYRLSKTDDKRMKDEGNDKAVTLKIVQTFFCEIIMLSCVSYKGERSERIFEKVCLLHYSK